jgi:putative copper export protein
MPAIHDIISIILRAAGFVAGLQAAGVALFLLLIAGPSRNSIRRVRSLGKYTAIAGMLFALAHYLVEPARMVGALSGMFDPAMHALLLDTNIAAATALRISGLAMLAISMRFTGRLSTAAGLIGAALFFSSFSLVGHTVAHDLRPLLVLLLAAHLIVVAFWFGSLFPLITVSKHEGINATGLIIDRFSRIAAWTVPVLFFVGIGMSITLLEHWENLWAPYGYLLLVKVAGFAILMGLATLNKWRLAPRIAHGSSTALAAFRRSAAAEWYVIAAVLAVTAVMTGLFSPIH